MALLLTPAAAFSIIITKRTRWQKFVVEENYDCSRCRRCRSVEAHENDSNEEFNIRMRSLSFSFWGLFSNHPVLNSLLSMKIKQILYKKQLF